MSPDLPLMTSISDQNLLAATQKQQKNVSRSPNNAAMASVLTTGKPNYTDMACYVTKSNPNYPDMSYASTKEHMGSVMAKDLTRSVLAKDHVSSVLFTKDQMGVRPLTTDNMEPSVLTKDYVGSSDLTKEVVNSDLLTKPSLDMASALRSENPSPCPRCQSLDTKFCYFNNYNAKQPRHFCKSCQRYWTAGGSLRNLPVGAGKRKHRSSSTSMTASAMMKKSQRYEIGEDGDCDGGATFLMKSQRCTKIDDNDDLHLVMNAQRVEIVDDEDDDLGEVISAEASSSFHNKIMRSAKHYHHLLPNGKISIGFGSNNREVSPGIHGFSSASCGTMSNTHDISQEKEVEEALRPSMHSFKLKDHKDAPSSQKDKISGRETKALCVNISPDSHMDSDSEASASAPQPSPTFSPSSHNLSPWGAQPLLAPWPWPTPRFNSNDASVAFAHASASFWPFSPPMWTPFGWSSVPWNVVMNASNNNNSASTVENHENRGQQQDTLCTPKTLKIGDPDEVMHSSILTTLGLMNVASPVSVSSFFNADSHAKLDDSNQKLGGIQDHPQQPIEVEKILYTNPAALARSLAFQEGK